MVSNLFALASDQIDILFEKFVSSCICFSALLMTSNEKKLLMNKQFIKLNIIDIKLSLDNDSTIQMRG